MLAIRVSALVILTLALGVGPPAFAQTTVYPQEQVFVGGNNNMGDTTYLACDYTYGCFDGNGDLCSANPTTRCRVALVPAGRCTKGSGSCVWPSGAGACVDSGPEPDYAPAVPCLPDNPADRGATTGTFFSTLCPGPGKLCDMATNDPSCECQGTDPSLSTWEGEICSSPPMDDKAAFCSDGGMNGSQFVGNNPSGDTIGAFGTALCTHIALTISAANDSWNNCGFGSTQDGNVDTTLWSVENEGKVYTLQRKPGAGLSAPTHPIHHFRSTSANEIDNVGSGDFAAWGIRRSRGFSDASFADALYTSGETTNSELNSIIMTYNCDPPEFWSTDQPVRGFCFDDPATTGVDESDTACVTDAPCLLLSSGSYCDPLTFVYCNEQQQRDSSGFLWTRDLTTTELSAGGKLGVCPPDCGTMTDFDSFEMEAIIQVGNPPDTADPRASVQLALNNTEGPRAGQGDFLSMTNTTSISWVTKLPAAGDFRCYIGGDPLAKAGDCNTCAVNTDPIGCCAPPNEGTVTDASCFPANDPNGDAECLAKIGRCSGDRRPCNPTVGGATECGGGQTCNFCGGTYDGIGGAIAGLSGPYVDCPECEDSVNGNALALPVGYNSHGFSELDLVQHNRVFNHNNQPSAVRNEITFLFTSAAATSRFLDSSCPGFGLDRCALGQSTGGDTGIGAGGSFTTAQQPEHDPSGPNFQYDVSWNPHTPGTEQDPQFVYNKGPGPDGIGGCAGDNTTWGGDLCDGVLGDDAGHPGSTGTDDLPVMVDYSPAQDGSDWRRAVIAEWKMTDPFADRPVLQIAAAVAERDLDIFGQDDNLDITVKSSLTYCPIVGDGPDCTRGAFCSDRGFDVPDGDGICNDDDPDDDNDGLLDPNDGCPMYFNAPPYVDSNGDGIPNDCQCGDTDNDGFITPTDAFTLITCAGAGGPQCAAIDMTLWDTDNDGFATPTDAFSDLNRGNAGTQYLNTCARRPSGVPAP